jgi:hypothetical protein
VGVAVDGIGVLVDVSGGIGVEVAGAGISVGTGSGVSVGAERRMGAANRLGFDVAVGVGASLDSFARAETLDAGPGWEVCEVAEGSPNFGIAAAASSGNSRRRRPSKGPRISGSRSMSP